MAGSPDAYAELAAATGFSFLRGASQPATMVETAIALGHRGIGIADRNTVAGVVRAWSALNQLRDAGIGHDFRLLTGARLVFADDTPDMIAYPATRKGWGRLTRMLSVGNLRTAKGGCHLFLADLLEWCEDWALIVLPFRDFGAAGTPDFFRVRSGNRDAALHAPLNILRNRVEHLWLGATMNRLGRDRRQLANLKAISAETGIPLIAVNDALYASPGDRPLHDVMACIREGTSIDKAGRMLAANAERHLKPPSEMVRLFADCPEAIAQTQELLACVDFDLGQLRYEYPHEPVPEGWAPDDWLAHLAWSAAIRRHPHGIPRKLRETVCRELAFIRAENYACYFLTVHDLVRFAREQQPPILCQGRGSAANSAVCFLLGVTSVDPMQYDLLFSRFVSADRKEPPDIDVDFEHERREEVMQYVYRRYGRHRAGIVATVIHYRPRSAVREVGKALGLTEDVTAKVVETVWGSFGSGPDDRRLREAGFDPDNPEIARLKALSEQILNYPRHLSQHVGGFVLTEDRLDETVPIHNAAMADRTFIEWDKDDIDALKLMKVDVLALGMLTCIRKAYDIMRSCGLGDHDLTVDIDSSDPAVYDMLCKGDSIGVFQVESRAQINMLPRMKPRTLYDLTIQVAIVRPGPIQGDMVHPYLRRRSGLEAVAYPSPAPEHGPADELFAVLGKTKGVPLFQEQAMKLAMVAAKFTDSEANQLRRAMATFRNNGGMDAFRTKLVGGMVSRGYPQDFAERCYRQIEGFGSYGFPESHALSFARLVYVSSWIKCHYPAVFAAALLNSQPMGFYAPAQIVRDAREHGVDVLPIDVNESEWDNGVMLPSRLREGLGVGQLRLGLRQIDGFRDVWAEAIAANRPYASLEELARKAALPPRALRLLADADAMRSLGSDRREAAWEALRTPRDELPLFAAARARELGEEPDAALPVMQPGEHIAADYQTIRLSLKGHPMEILRPVFARESLLSCTQVSQARAGARIGVAGIVLVRQRPGNGKAIFLTMEDETGVTNIIMWARTFERYRRAVMAARLMEVRGEVQRSPEGVIHVMAHRIIDRSAELSRLSATHRPNPQLSRADEFLHPQQPRHGHPRNVRVLPKSRDFH